METYRDRLKDTAAEPESNKTTPADFGSDESESVESTSGTT
ncbi:MAG: hypothetical protein ACLFNI_00390 [Natronomonas sp.]